MGVKYRWHTGHDKGAENASIVCIAATAVTAAVAEERSPSLSPRDAAVWAKQRILGYSLGAQRVGENFLALESEQHGVGVAVPNAASGDYATVTPHKFLRWCHLEAADFGSMAMSPRGTVIFLSDNPSILFVDREALDTGPALCSVSISRRVWSFTLTNEWYPDTHYAERILVERDSITRLGMRT